MRKIPAAVNTFFACGETFLSAALPPIARMRLSALKVISKVYGLGDPDGFVFNMSVGYDLEGIKGRKVNTYINNMMDAGKTAQFKECKKVLTELFPEEKDFIASISSQVYSSFLMTFISGFIAPTS